MGFVFRAMLVLNLVYCLVGFLTNTLPVWRMFESLTPMNVSLLDKDGASIDIRAYLPSDAYILNSRQVSEVVTFICENHRDRGPFVLTEKISKKTVEVDPSDCQTKL